MSFYLPALARGGSIVRGGKAQWATRLGGGVNEGGNSMASDSQKNVYVTGGYFSNPITFYNSNGSTFATMANTVNNDGYLVKYNSSGTVQWATRINGNSVTGFENSWSVTTDSQDNVYIAGVSDSTTLVVNSFGSVSLGSITLVQYGTINLVSTDSFIIKYNPSGTVLWATTINGGVSGAVYALSIRTDYNNNVCVAGSYQNQTCVINNFNGGGGGGPITNSVYATLDSTNNPNGQIFIVKYSSSGQAIWATYFASTGTINHTGGLAIDTNNNIYLSGVFLANMSLNSYISKSGTTINESLYGNLIYTNVINAGQIYLVKINLAGTVQWGTSIGGSSFDFTQYDNICVDYLNNICICGLYRTGTIAINNFNSVSITNDINVSAFGTLTDTELNSIFIAKYNANGNALWATKYGSSATIRGYSIITDSNANVYLGGSYSNLSCKIYSYNGLISPGSNITLSTYGTLQPIGSFNVLLIKFSPVGQALWATNMGGGTSFNGGSGITKDNDNNIYMSGTYDSNPLIINNFSSVSSGNINTATFGALLNSGGSDVFIVKYSP
jgi:hypothetical protein